MQKIILITGASSGLGLALSKKLLLKENERGEKENIIIALSNNQKELEENFLSFDFKEKENRKNNFNNLEKIFCDITNEKDIKRNIEKIIKKYGRIDILINNAGVWIEGKLENCDTDEIKRVIEINLLGHIFMTKNILPYMKKIKSGKIINVISEAGLYGKAERSIYHASKYAMRGFTDSLAEELSKENISVIGFYPSKMKTGFFEKAGFKKDKNEFEKYLDIKEAVRCLEFIIDTNDGINIPIMSLKKLSEY